MMGILIVLYLFLGSIFYGIFIAETETYPVIKAILWPFVVIAAISNKLYTKYNDSNK
jgi:lipopolysaccharide export LptBFGC system permease protein LptF